VKINAILNIQYVTLLLRNGNIMLEYSVRIETNECEWFI